MQEIKFDSRRLLYIRVKNFDGEEAEVRLRFPKEMIGRYVRIEAVQEDSNATPVKANCTEEECYDCGHVGCSVHYGNALLKDVPPPPEENQ